MNTYATFIVILTISFIINFLINRLPIFRDKKRTSAHKSFTGIKSMPPFSGGIIFLLTLFIFLPNDQYLLKLFCLVIFLIGIFSDIQILKSPNFRFFLQLLTVVIFVILSQTFITSIKINIIDLILENFLIKFFFTTFCILILINGTNFMDGVNTLAIGYYMLILFFLQNVFLILGDQTIPAHILDILIFLLVSFFILNFFNLMYLGDNGAYLISFIIGVWLINLSENHISVSPYYIVNLLWYPAYENLFSILRKLKNKSSPLQPDNFHLHQLIFIFLEKKLKNKKIINTLTGCVINLYNLLLFFLATQDYSNTKYQLSLIFMSLLIYSLLYMNLKFFIFKK